MSAPMEPDELDEIIRDLKKQRELLRQLDGDRMTDDEKRDLIEFIDRAIREHDGKRS